MIYQRAQCLSITIRKTIGMIMILLSDYDSYYYLYFNLSAKTNVDTHTHRYTLQSYM